MPDNTDTYTLEARYLDLCKKHRVLPNPGVMSWLHKVMEQKHKNLQKCTMVVFLNKLYDADISPLIDVFLDSKIDSVSIFLKSFCVVSHENILRLLRVASCSKLQNVDLQDMNLSNDIIREIFEGGLDCHSLKLRFNDVQTLNFGGRFKSLHTLNLDFCSSLTTIEKAFFDQMSNLRCLSMCGTNVANLWTTSAALSRLNYLTELRFQNRVCCKNTGPCPLLSAKTARLIPADGTFVAGKTLEKVKTSQLHADFMKDLHGFSSIDLNSTGSKEEDMDMEAMNHAKFHIQEQSESPTSILNFDQVEWVAPETYVLKCPSPICYEKHYREYMITTLPSLQVLDNVHTTNTEYETAKMVVSMSFEHLPYKRRINESITSILRSRETGSNRTKQTTLSQVHYSRSILAAKLGSTDSPSLLPLCRNMINGMKRVRPRQFEYHPSDSSLMAFGTLDGEMVIMNHEKGHMLKCIPSIRENDRALALCWLNKHPSKLLAGFDNGALRLYDINQIPSKHFHNNNNWSSKVLHYDDFKTLTSVHVNATDEKFLASSYSRNVVVFDVSCGTRLQLFSDIHREPINVAKFAQCSPHLFVTSSFDRDVKMWDLRQRPVKPCYSATSSKGNVMVCFSPNDLYLLVSAVDNEVKQLLAVDGRLHTNFDIVPTGSLQNYTRSYYMNGRDYVITGSSEESVVRVCCGQTGKRLRDIHLKDGNGSSYFVHSLRSDPFCHFNMAVLAGSHRPSSPWDIVKVNMLSSDHSQGVSTD